MKIPKEVNNLIEKYFNLDIGDKKIRTPYYRNKKHTRGGELKSLVGKGNPSEIELEVKIFAKLRGVNLRKIEEEEIQDFMRQEGIGIDCSGLISNILELWFKTEYKKKIYQVIKFKNKTFRDKTVKYLRPIQNLPADILTNNDNTIPIDLKNVEIGDLIRLKGLKQGDHICMVIDILKKDGKKILEYIHSTPHYGKNSGIKKGIIVITDEEKGLEEQKWLELDENNICWTLKEYLKDQEDNGIRRLKFFINKK